MGSIHRTSNGCSATHESAASAERARVQIIMNERIMLSSVSNQETTKGTEEFAMAGIMRRPVTSRCPQRSPGSKWDAGRGFASLQKSLWPSVPAGDWPNAERVPMEG